MLCHAVFLIPAHHALAFFQHFGEQLRQAVQYRRAKHKIHIRETLFQFFPPVLLRHHTAADPDDQIRIFFFEVLVLPDNGKRAFFGMLPDGAGVDQNQRGICRVIGRKIPQIFRHAGEFFAVRHVLLTAEGHHKHARFFAVRGKICRRMPPDGKNRRLVTVK